MKHIARTVHVTNYAKYGTGRWVTAEIWPFLCPQAAHHFPGLQQLQTQVLDQLFRGQLAEHLAINAILLKCRRQVAQTDLMQKGHDLFN